MGNVWRRAQPGRLELEPGQPRPRFELARGAGRPGIVHDLIPPRNGSAGVTTGVEQRLTDLFRHCDFSYRRQFVLRGRRIQDERIPAATIKATTLTDGE